MTKAKRAATHTPPAKAKQAEQAKPATHDDVVGDVAELPPEAPPAEQPDEGETPPAEQPDEGEAPVEQPDEQPDEQPAADPSAEPPVDGDAAEEETSREYPTPEEVAKADRRMGMKKD